MNVRIAVMVMIAVALVGAETGCRPPPIKPPQPARGLIYGLDAATWKVLLPLMRQGKLPVLDRCFRDGSHGDLQTLSPTVSVVIWTSMVTGKLPQGHGIFNWTRRGDDGQTGQLAITSNLRTAQALWNITGARQLRPLFINWWASWPAEQVDGAIISNRFQFKDLNYRT